uniref:Phosphoesterase PA-phosphatase related protein n=1 Tax=Geobacter sp. (strain M21) TaxID=443144 RepID=C6E154_GEOSM
MQMIRRFLLQLLDLLEPRRRPELWSLVAVFVVVSGLWAFGELGDEIRGEPRSFDRTILLSLRSPDAPDDPIGPRWVEEMARDFTSFGGEGVLTFVLLAAAGFLFLNGNIRTILLLFAATIGGGTLTTFLKLHYDRPRPDLVSPLAFTTSQSFPSGHALLAAATYLTLGALLARVQPNHALRAYLMFLAIMLTFLVGVSRVYLGVHWPTDVLAGWTIGAVWALTCSLVAYWLQRIGHMDRED